jgi:hypothetical protein
MVRPGFRSFWTLKVGWTLGSVRRCEERARRYDRPCLIITTSDDLTQTTRFCLRQARLFLGCISPYCIPADSHIPVVVCARLLCNHILLLRKGWKQKTYS